MCSSRGGAGRSPHQQCAMPSEYMDSMDRYQAEHPPPTQAQVPLFQVLPPDAAIGPCCTSILGQGLRPNDSEMKRDHRKSRKIRTAVGNSSAPCSVRVSPSVTRWDQIYKNWSTTFKAFSLNHHLALTSLSEDTARHDDVSVNCGITAACQVCINRLCDYYLNGCLRGIGHCHPSRPFHNASYAQTFI